MNSLVSICIPVFNGEKYLAEAMESALSQTYRPLEIIVSDDESKDGSLKIIKSFISKTTIPIHIFKHYPNGIGANWNNCIKHAQGKYIKFLFQDDVLQPDCIEKMVAIASKSKKIGLVFSRRSIIHDPNNEYHLEWIKKHGDLQEGWQELKQTYSGKKLLKTRNLFTPPINKIGEPTATLIRKKVFDKVGFFNEELKQTLDYEFWYRLLAVYDVGFSNKELVCFRLHDEQATFINSRKKNSDEREIFEKSLMNKKVFWHLHSSIQFRLIKRNNALIIKLSKAKQLFKSSILRS